VLALYVSYRGR